jgi:hypothetical protein
MTILVNKIHDKLRNNILFRWCWLGLVASEKYKCLHTVTNKRRNHSYTPDKNPIDY